MRKGPVVFFWAIAILCGYGSDWPAWRGPDRNGISPETGWNPNRSKILWTRELGAGYSAVSTRNGKLYTMGRVSGAEKDQVYCLDAETGKELWSYAYDSPSAAYEGPRATPVCDGDTLYTFSRDGLLIAFEADTGAVRWKTDVLDRSGNQNIRWGLASSPVVEGNLILLNVGSAGVAVDKTDGKLVWKSRGMASYATPVVFDHQGRRLAAFFSGTGLQIAEVATGKTVSSFNWETRHDVHGADPLLIGDTFFISSGYGRGSALLDFSSGRLVERWQNDLLRAHFSSSVYIDGCIYGVDGQTKSRGHLRCISAADGVERWSERIGFGSLMAADGKLIVLNEEGLLYFVEASADGYREISKTDTGLGRLCWTAPVLSNGIIYCRNDKGTLVAIDVRN